MNLGVEKIRAAFKHHHSSPLAGMQAGECGGDRCFTLARGWRGDQQGRAFHGLPVQTRHRLHSGGKSMFLIADLADCIGGSTQGIGGGAPGDDDVLH